MPVAAFLQASRALPLVEMALQERNRPRGLCRDGGFFLHGLACQRGTRKLPKYFRDAVLEIVDPNVLKHVVD